MKFAWRGKYSLRISQRKDVIRRRLQYETTNSETEMFARRVFFTGNVEEDSFKIMRTRIASKASDLCTRDSGSPVLHGHMYEADEETIIDIKWNLPMLSAIFACIWLTGIGFGLFVVIMAQDFAAIFWVTVMLAIGLWMFFPGVGSSLTEVKKTLIDVIVAPGESWREYEGDKGDEWNV